MAVQKFIKYNQLDQTGKIIDNENTLTLKIIEKSGNYLIHRDIIRHQLNQKQGTLSTKTRGEVRGGGRKPWRQKGTGRARAGSNRSPLWKGGGVIFGPKPKTNVTKLNKKERNLALQTLLYNKRNNIVVIDDLEFILKSPKTKQFCDFCNICKINLKQNILMIVSEKTRPLILSTKNVRNLELISVLNLNTLSLLKAKQILITSSALNLLKETYCD